MRDGGKRWNPRCRHKDLGFSCRKENYRDFQRLWINLRWFSSGRSMMSEFPLWYLASKCQLQQDSSGQHLSIPRWTDSGKLALHIGHICRTRLLRQARVGWKSVWKLGAWKCWQDKGILAAFEPSPRLTWMKTSGEAVLVELQVAFFPLFK